MSNPEFPNKRQKLENDDDLWRKSAPGFVHLLRSMFGKGIHTDVTIKVESQNRSSQIECHSLILSAHSPVFSAILSERWNGDNKDCRRLVTLTDDDPEHFSLFVKMMYWDWNKENFNSYDVPVSVTPELAVGVLSLAHKYLACHLIRHAEHLIFCFLAKRSPSDTVKLYTLLNRLPICGEKQVARKTLKTVENCLLADGENIFSSDAILQLSRSELSSCVRQYSLKCPEQIVFQGCLKWAKEHCKVKKLKASGKNIRAVLKTTSQLIRFPILDKLTITNEVIPSKILDHKDITKLLVNVIGKDCSGVKKNPTKFSILKRLDPKLLRIDIYSRFCQSSTFDNSVDFSTPHGFTMTLSKKMLLQGVQFLCGDSTPQNYKFHLEIEVLQKSYEVKREKKDFSCSGSKSAVYIDIVPEVKIPADIPVNLKFAITGGNNRVSTEFVDDTGKEISYLGDQTIFITFKSSHHLPNGLKKVPMLMFSACNDSDSDSDTSSESETD